MGDAQDDGVTSHYERLLALNPKSGGHLADFARSGTRMRDFARQAQEAVDFKADYVTVMFGANDICGGRNMTEPETFRAQFVAGADALKALPAGARATPMTYQVTPGGRQYVAISVGGSDDWGKGDYLVPFARPR